MRYWPSRMKPQIEERRDRDNEPDLEVQDKAPTMDTFEERDKNLGHKMIKSDMLK